MTKQEAIAWLKGERSSCNTIPEYPLETWQVRIAQADAAYTQQAYWILKADMELGQPNYSIKDAVEYADAHKFPLDQRR